VRAGRCFWAFLGRFDPIPGVLVPGVRVLGVASQGVTSPWALLVLVVASSGPGGFRLTRFLRAVAGELWLASCGWLGILRGVL